MPIQWITNPYPESRLINAAWVTDIALVSNPHTVRYAADPDHSEVWVEQTTHALVATMLDGAEHILARGDEKKMREWLEDIGEGHY